MAVRTRSRDLSSNVSGNYQKVSLGGPVVWRTVSQTDTTTTDDTVGWWHQPNAFTSTRIVYEVASVTGVTRGSSGNVLTIVNQLPLAYNVLPPLLPAEPSTLELDFAAREIRAGTNPSLPSFNLGTSLGELRDLGDIMGGIRRNGFSLLKAAAGGYVTFRFAYEPMMSDLRKMAYLANALQQRMRELRRLRDGKVLKRRVDLGTTVEELANTNVTLESASVSLPAVRHGRITRHRWGTAQWKLSPGTVLPESEVDLKEFAFNLETGITTASALRTVWELFPWSWLIDWFLQLSENLEANDNSIGLSVGPMCLMETTTSEWTYSPRDTLTDAWGSMALSGIHRQSRTRKLRRVATTVLPITLPRWPMLTRRHWSILAALATCRLAPGGFLDGILGERSGFRAPGFGRAYPRL